MFVTLPYLPNYLFQNYTISMIWFLFVLSGTLALVLYVYIKRNAILTRTKAKILKKMKGAQSRKKSNTFGNILAVIAIIISSIALALNFYEVKSSDEVKVVFSCSYSKAPSIEVLENIDVETNTVAHFAYKTSCTVKNLGKAQTAIADIKSVAFESNEVTLNRTLQDISLYRINQINTDVKLPILLESKSMHKYETKTFLPIVLQDECVFSNSNEAENDDGRCIKDIRTKLEQIAKKLKTCSNEDTEECLNIAINKYPADYLYGGVKVPVFMGYQPFNGIGQQIELLDGTKLVHEADLTGVSSMYYINKNVRVLQGSGSMSPFEKSEISKPWYSKKYYYKTSLESKSSTTLLLSLINYFFIVTAIIGWSLVIKALMRRIRNLRNRE